MTLLVKYVLRTRQSPDNGQDTVITAIRPETHPFVELSVVKGGDSIEATGTTLSLEQARVLVGSLQSLIEKTEQLCTPS